MNSLSSLFRTHPDGAPACPSQPHQILTFRPSPIDPDATIIERGNQNYTTTPLFCITSQKSSKEVEIRRIGAGNHPIQPILVGTSRYSSLKSATQITIAGYPAIKMGANPMTGNEYKFTLPLGLLGGSTMKWKSKTSGELVLLDDNKLELARYSSDAGYKGAGASKLEILVLADDFLLDMIVVTWMAAVKMLEKDRAAIEILGEVIGGIAGN